jgi:hypothetical protein
MIILLQSSRQLLLLNKLHPVLCLANLDTLWRTPLGLAVFTRTKDIGRVLKVLLETRPTTSIPILSVAIRAGQSNIWVVLNVTFEMIIFAQLLFAVVARGRNLCEIRGESYTALGSTSLSQESSGQAHLIITLRSLLAEIMAWESCRTIFISSSRRFCFFSSLFHRPRIRLRSVV